MPAVRQKRKPPIGPRPPIPMGSNGISTALMGRTDAP